LGLHKLETWAAVAVTWRLGLGGLEQAGVRLYKVEAWAAVRRAVVAMGAMTRVIAVQETWWWHGTWVEDSELSRACLVCRRWYIEGWR